MQPAGQGAESQEECGAKKTEAKNARRTHAYQRFAVVGAVLWFGGHGGSWCVVDGAVHLLVAIHISCACGLDAMVHPVVLW